MVRRCCIVTCRNGRSDCDERVSFFKVPSEQSLFERWVKAVGPTGSQLYKSSAICERHFRNEEIRREAVLKDSSGNVIFQRPLTKFSLLKDAVPSIFKEDIDSQTALKKRRKRRTAISEDPENVNNTGNFTINNDGSLNLNYSNILVAFNDNLNNLVHFSLAPNNLQSGIITLDAKDEEKNNENNLQNNAFNITNFYLNGQENGNIINNINYAGHLRNDQDKFMNNIAVPDEAKSIISIYVKPQSEMDKNNVNNNIEKANTNETLISLDTSDVAKDQAAQKISNQFNDFHAINLEAPKEVTIIVPDEEIIILNQNNCYNNNTNNNVQKHSTSKPKSAQPKVKTIQYPLPESDIQMNIRAFDLIFHNSHKIKLPNPMWGYHKNGIDKDIIIFSKAMWFKSDVLIPPIYQKQVIFHESDNVKIYINNKFSPLEVRRPKDIEEMEVILNSVDEIVVCSGGPNIGECDTAHCAQKDYAVSRWRHKLCPIIIEAGETICKFCSTINQVMRYPKKKRLAFGRRAVQEDS